MNKSPDQASPSRQETETGRDRDMQEIEDSTGTSRTETDKLKAPESVSCSGPARQPRNAASAYWVRKWKRGMMMMRSTDYGWLRPGLPCLFIHPSYSPVISFICRACDGSQQGERSQ